MRATITYRVNGSAQCQCTHATSPLTPAVQYLLRYMMRLVIEHIEKSIPTFGISSSLGDDVSMTNIKDYHIYQIYVITLFTSVIIYLTTCLTSTPKMETYFPVINGKKNQEDTKIFENLDKPLHSFLAIPELKVFNKQATVKFIFIKSK